MQVVTKTWGREVVQVNTSAYCMKELHVAAGMRCSLHYHLAKDETFVVESGRAIAELAGQVRVLTVGDMLRVRPKQRHRFGSIDGCVLREVSTHHDDDDVVRLEPSGLMPPTWGQVSGQGLSQYDRQQLREMRQRPGTTALVPGCFDVLHPGHLVVLSEASMRAGHVVVAVNSDDSVRRLKGPGRPIMPAAQRAAVLRSLRWVDLVVVFDADTPVEVARELKPDLVVKGPDWNGKPVPEAEGAELLIINASVEQRTTKLVERMRAAAAIK